MDFLDEYIHLEKLCNDIYRTNHGISKYIEDLESASYATIRKIPSWESTYKKLKELRWKRNKYVHEGVSKLVNGIAVKSDDKGIATALFL